MVRTPYLWWNKGYIADIVLTFRYVQMSHFPLEPLFRSAFVTGWPLEEREPARMKKKTEHLVTRSWHPQD